jgi:hypothetical protein
MEQVRLEIREDMHIFYNDIDNVFCSFLYNKQIGLYEVEVWGSSGRKTRQFMSMARILKEREKDKRTWEFVGVL